MPSRLASKFTPMRASDIEARAVAKIVLVALGLESRAAVDALVAKAIEAGGKEPRPSQDHGFMVQRTIEDPDGHVWEPFWMDPAHVQPTG